MGFINWEEKYSVGHELMDSHHREMFRIINHLHERLVSSDEFSVESILLELKEYGQYHFLNEENLLQEIGYPDLMKQQVQHDIFHQKIDDFLKEMKAHNAGFAIRLMSFLKEWLVLHILDYDMAYKPYLKKDSI